MDFHNIKRLSHRKRQFILNNTFKLKHEDNNKKADTRPKLGEIRVLASRNGLSHGSIYHCLPHGVVTYDGGAVTYDGGVVMYGGGVVSYNGGGEMHGGGRSVEKTKNNFLKRPSSAGALLNMCLIMRKKVSTFVL